MSANALVEALTQLTQQQQQQQGTQQQGSQAWSGSPDGAGRPRSGPTASLEEGAGQLLLQQMLLGEMDAATGGSQGDDSLLGSAFYDNSRPQSDQPLLGDGYQLSMQGGASSSNSMPQQPAVEAPPATYIQSTLSLPNVILVNESTDSLQAGGLINFTFSQSAHSSFVLNTQLDQAGSTSVPVLTAALRVVLSARRINQQAVARFDLGFVPFLVTDAAEGIGLMIYKCSINPDVAKVRGQVLKMDATSNPLIAGISLFNMVQTGTQQLEVIFTADAAKVALQALSIMRINLANNGRDVLLLLSTVDYTADASGPKNYFLVKLTPITPPLPCFQHQIEAPKPAAFMADPSMLAHSQGLSTGPMHPQQQQPSRMHPPALGAMLAPGHAGMPGVGPKHGTVVGAASLAYPGTASASALSAGHAATAAAASSAKQQRARKADYVIVTEDTAIKNAAGAIAKVLGRVSNQGQCCPVYTEKKTESFTTVISVAVKAIAVARGYVCNEGMGNEVGFQPYLRHLDRRLDLLDLHQYLASDHRKAAAAAASPSAAVLSAAGMGGGMGHSAMGPKGPGMGLLGGHMLPGGPHSSALMAASMATKGPGASHLMGHMGHFFGTGGGHPSHMDAYELLDEDALQDERCELAFDVFKVPQLVELHDVGNLPVKVTAHSRPNVVSNIISKLVSERNGAVLITAGGKAMHVAMTAVVSARARLKAKGVDIILLPKFVTVDTTSTLGWESVFLRFTIVRWAAAPQLHQEAMAAAGRYMGLPAMGPVRA